MKVLTHSEMLAFPEAQDFLNRENPTRLADYLVRRLCNKKLSDFNISEGFKIEAPIATLSIDENGAKLESKHKSTETLVSLFARINAVQDNVKKLSLRAKNMKTAGEFRGVRKFAESSIGTAKGELGIVADEVFKERISICETCENWESKIHQNFGRCKACGGTSARFRLNTAKCPLGKWLS